MARAFKYEPVDTSQREIRLLLVTKVPSSPIPAVEYTLRRFSLRDYPDYYALSYTWGPELPSYQVTINRCVFPVRENLYDFLCEYSQQVTKKAGNRQRSFYLWIDNICIDQTNTPERNHQVRLMDKIYESAKTTLIWLGRGDENSYRAIKSIKRRFITSFLPFLSSGKRDVQSFLGSNPYWKRIWIVQEVLLSRKLKIMCGSKTLSFDSLDSYWNEKLRWRSPSAVDGLLQMKASSIIRYKSLEHDLLTLARLFHENGCQDPRDKVFALQSLAYLEDKQEIDYTKNTEMVWMDTVVRYLLDTVDHEMRTAAVSLSSAAGGDLIHHPRALVALFNSMGLVSALEEHTRQELKELNLTTRDGRNRSNVCKLLFNNPDPALQSIRSEATQFVEKISQSMRTVSVPSASAKAVINEANTLKSELCSIVSHVAAMARTVDLPGVHLNRFEKFNILLEHYHPQLMWTPLTDQQSPMQMTLHDGKMAPFVDITIFALQIVLMVGKLESGILG